MSSTQQDEMEQFMRDCEASAEAVEQAALAHQAQLEELEYQQYERDKFEEFKSLISNMLHQHGIEVVEKAYFESLSDFRKVQ